VQAPGTIHLITGLAYWFIEDDGLFGGGGATTVITHTIRFSLKAQ